MERTELETIIYEKDGPIARIVLNLPDKANIQTAQQVWDFEDALKWANRDEEVKVLIVKANGNGFCAGHAIVEPEEMAEVYPTTGPTFERTWKNHNYELFLWPPLNLWEFPKATIAQVHGYCLGGGTVYGYLTDLTIASDDAYFQMPLPQGFGLPGAQTLIEPWALMNWKRAYEYLYLAPTLSAEQAREWGLVNKVVPRRPRGRGGGDRPHHRPDAADHHPHGEGRSEAGMGDDGHAGAPAEHRRLHLDRQRGRATCASSWPAARGSARARWRPRSPRSPATENPRPHKGVQRGRPSPCSAMMLRLISVVPPAMVDWREEVSPLAQGPARPSSPIRSTATSASSCSVSDPHELGPGCPRRRGRLPPATACSSLVVLQRMQAIRQ